MTALNDSERALKYYQAQSENSSCEVFHSKERCSKEFPNSEIIEMFGDSIELPSFIDIPTIIIHSRLIAEVFCASSGSYIDTNDYIDDNYRSALCGCVVKR